MTARGNTRDRQQQLLQRSALLRTRVAGRAAALGPAFTAAGIIMNAGRAIQRHRIGLALTGTIVCLVAFRRPAQMLRLARRTVALLPAVSYLLPYALRSVRSPGRRRPGSDSMQSKAVSRADPTR